MVRPETAPTAIAEPTAGSPNHSNGEVVGRLNIVDGDGDDLTYKVLTAPVHGNVTINADTGVYRYTPTQAARLQAATISQADSFTVAVTDGKHPPVLVTVDHIDVSPARFLVDVERIEVPIRVGESPTDIAVSADGTRAYVVNHDAFSSLSVIDTTRGVVIATVDIDFDNASPGEVVVSPDGSRVYVALRLDLDDPGEPAGAVAVINAVTNEVVGVPIRVGASDVQSVAVSPDGSLLYALSRDDKTVTVIDPVSGAVVGAVIPVGANPQYLALSADGATAFVTNAGDRHGVDDRHRCAQEAWTRHDRCRRHSDRGGGQPGWLAGVCGQRRGMARCR